VGGQQGAFRQLGQHWLILRRSSLVCGHRCDGPSDERPRSSSHSRSVTAARTRFTSPTVQDRATKRVLLQGRCRGGLYPVPSLKSTSFVSSHRALSGVKLSIEHWHQRLGHPSKDVIESVLRSNKFACAPSESSV
uniref:GAG-pre-integrase domain-containing protein n=1 Tax=Triticum urartu TaxID=4572 RepID=A0A8R7V064_TRIUA